jgi:peptide chain release factor subunit 1
MSAAKGGVDEAGDRQVEMWKIKKLIKSLQQARGNGTSMISLVIPPGDQVRVSCNSVVLI